MKIEFIERNYDIGKRLTKLIEQKINKLDRYFGEEAKARVVCSQQNKTYKLELTITNMGVLYRSEVIGENMFENIDSALPKIEKQIVKRNDKKKSILRNVPDFTDFLFLTEKPEINEKEILKKKSFDLDPITIEDAKLNMEGLEHDFYVFLNAETGKINILYKRKDEKLGLIECNY